MTEAQIRETFRYHPPDAEQARLHGEIQEIVIEATVKIANLLKPSRERSLLCYRHAGRENVGQCRTRGTWGGSRPRVTERKATQGWRRGAQERDGWLGVPYHTSQTLESPLGEPVVSGRV